MSWLDGILERRPAPKPVRAVPVVRPAAAPPRPNPEIKSVFVQTRGRGGTDAGAGRWVFYSVQDGILTMHDDQGKQVGVHALADGEDPRHMAYRIGREKIFTGDDGPAGFNRSLYYPPQSVV